MSDAIDPADKIAVIRSFELLAEGIRQSEARIRRDIDDRPTRAEMNDAIQASQAAMMVQIAQYFDRFERRMQQGFAEVNRRFEESDRRQEAMRADMNRRFEESDRRQEAMRADMNRRFEESDRRQEEMRTDMNRRFDGVEGRLGAVDGGLETVDRRLAAASGDHGSDPGNGTGD